MRNRGRRREKYEVNVWERTRVYESAAWRDDSLSDAFLLAGGFNNVLPSLD